MRERGRKEQFDLDSEGIHVPRKATESHHFCMSCSVREVLKMRLGRQADCAKTERG